MEHIHYTICPECGSPFYKLEQEVEPWSLTNQFPSVRRHTNGGNWEKVYFACGRVDAYVPNFLGISVEKSCNNSPARIDARKRHEKLVNQLLDAVGSVQGVDDDLRKKILHEIEWVCKWH